MTGLRTIQELYDRGLFLQAYEHAKEIGPLQAWRGASERILAGRLALQLGAHRLARVLHLLAQREHPFHDKAVFYGAQMRIESSGPLAGWRLLRRYETGPQASAETRSDVASLRARVAGSLRDFSTAERWFAEAVSIAPDNPWPLVERSMVLQKEDRYEDALVMAREALALQPGHSAALGLTAHLLQVLGRDEESLELLEDASGRLESGDLLIQLSGLQEELGLYLEASRGFDRLPELWPLMDGRTRGWFAARRSDLSYLRGDMTAALDISSDVDSPFHARVRETMSQATPESRRVWLGLDFVRQHHVTCAPATLSTVSRYWSMPADHLDLAEEICYGGTPHASQRAWAENNGWVAREFTVDWESSRALLDRGIPFTLGTQEMDSAHLQAVGGFDELRGTLLVRDPLHRNLIEFLGKEMLESYATVGPRGMVIVPREQADLLNGIRLPDERLYDLYYELESQLSRHDRADARKTLEKMKVAEPAHRLTLTAELAVAAYDSDIPSQLEACEKLCAKYPDSVHWQLVRSGLLGVLGREQDALAIMHDEASKHDTAPSIIRDYAQALTGDSRRLPEAIRLIHKSIRGSPDSASGFFVAGNLLQDARRFDEALDAYRFAASLEDTNEQFAAAYFSASRHFKRPGEALEFLEDRFSRFGRKSSGPIRTLVSALIVLERTTEAFASLQDAVALRPEDGDLLLFAADTHARYSQFEAAAQLLERARGGSRETDWLRTAARLQHYRGEVAQSLALWRQVLQVEPLAMDAHLRVTAGLQATQGRGAARAHLDEAVGRFPTHVELAQLRLEWLSEEDPESHEEAIRELLQVHPKNAWARRELADALARQKRFDDAFAELDEAERLEPHAPGLFNVKGAVQRMAGRSAEARVSFRHALGLAVDNTHAINGLLELAETSVERRTELEFVHDQLVRQVTFGDGLQAYREYASTALDPDDLLANLREALEARPDLWHFWSAVLRQLTDMRRFEEAQSIGREATERFPLQAALWADCGTLHRMRGDRDAEVEAFQRARMADPDWSTPTLKLVEVYQREGDFETCKGMLEAAVARNPLDATNHGFLANVLWPLGERDAAVASLERAVRLQPDYVWAWEQLANWSQALGRADLAVRLARELIEQRPGQPHLWMVLANMPGDDHPIADRLKAADQAVRLEPRNVEAHDLRAFLLAWEGKHDEALAACEPAELGDRPPALLRARAAWIEGQRGNTATAVSRMRRVMEEDDSIGWTWGALAQWYGELDDLEQLIIAAKQFVRLHPGDPAAVAALGEARLRTGDRERAIVDFTWAFALRPDFLGTGRQLFEMQLEDGQVEEAEVTTGRMSPYLAPHDLLTFKVELACSRGDGDLAADSFASLTQDQAATEWSLDTARKAMLAAGFASWRDRARAVAAKVRLFSQRFHSPGRS